MRITLDYSQRTILGPPNLATASGQPTHVGVTLRVCVCVKLRTDFGSSTTVVTLQFMVKIMKHQ